jgi:hypothetical protein
VHNMGPKCVWVSSIFFEKKINYAKRRQGKEEIGSIFVLHAITTMCTYNVGALLHLLLLISWVHSWLGFQKKNKDSITFLRLHSTNNI